MHTNSQQQKQNENRVNREKQEYQPRPWMCKNGHPIGWVVKRGNTRRLTVFADLHPVLFDDPPLATITGPAEVRCQICGETRTWDIHEDGLQELLAKRNHR